MGLVGAGALAWFQDSSGRGLIRSVPALSNKVSLYTELVNGLALGAADLGKIGIIVFTNGG